MQRRTGQRRAIRQAFEQAARPLSPAEVLELARREQAGLGIATVYRNLKALVEENWLAKVDLPGEATRYERAGLKHHHHFHCTQCGRAYDIDACPGNLYSLVPSGFELTDHEIVLYGRCAKCKRGKRGKKR